MGINELIDSRDMSPWEQSPHAEPLMSSNDAREIHACDLTNLPEAWRDIVVFLKQFQHTFCFY